MATIMATPNVMFSTTDPQWPKEIDFRDQWARWRVRKLLAKAYSLASEETTRKLPKEIHDLLPDISSKNIPAQKIPELGEFQPQDTLPSEMKVCIVGAGASGLFTAMILDWLNKKGETGKLRKLNISYDIFEANGEERLGGRLYTYKFPPTTVYKSGKKTEYKPGDHDYYDVGAMRFPDIPIMKRTFDLFEYVGLRKNSEDPHGKLIPYFMEHPNNPTYFNDVQFRGKPPPSNIDPYEWGSQRGEAIPDDLLKIGPGKALLKAIKDFRNALVNSPERGWQMLMDADKFSTRDFLMLPPLSQFKTVQGSDAFNTKQDGVYDPIGGPGYNFNTVEWLETFGSGTRSYSQAFSETVLGSLAFHYLRKGAKDSENSDKLDELDDLHDLTGSEGEWWCIDGGANVLAQEMAKKITGKIQYKNAVTSIARDKSGDTHNMIVGVNDAPVPHKYAAVFNSTTLGALQRMNLTAAGLNLGTKQAIRTLNYGASCKVGIWFSKPWWILSPHNIRGGLGKTDLPIRVCVYPSYNLPPDDDKDDENPAKPPSSPPKELPPAVLLCSYTWEQDASRLGAMITQNSPEGEDQLKRVLFDNLARLHKSPEHPYEEIYETIKESYITHHAYDWYQDPHSAGAFAFFGPFQFKEVWPDLTVPSADGKLLIIGEAASSHHAWVVGALESALRGVYQFLSRYAELYPEYKEAMEYLENAKMEDIDDQEDRPFLPLPSSFEKEMAKHQVVLSQARAHGLKDRIHKDLVQTVPKH